MAILPRGEGMVSWAFGHVEWSEILDRTCVVLGQKHGWGVRLLGGGMSK